MLVSRLKNFIVVFYLANNFLVYVVDTCFFLIAFTFLLYSIFKVLCLQTLLHLLVGTSGLEPPTSRLSGVRSNHLSYAPI